MVLLSVLNRRGSWMTALELFDASPDYPESEYVSTELRTLKSHGLIVSRQRQGSSLIEYGLPSWIKAPEPAFSLGYFIYAVTRFIQQLIAAV